MKKRILSAVPLISVLLFLASGLYLNNWSLGWTFFLLIPISWILLTGNPLKRLSESMPLLCVVAFLWLGFGFELWHPGWVVFLLIPLVNLIVEKRIDARKLVGVFVTAAFLTIGFITNEWHPTWIIFLLIPIINTLFFPQKNAFVNFGAESIKAKFKNIIIEHEKKDDDF